MRRTYDVNEKLADDLRASVTIIVGRASIYPPRDDVIGKNKKR